LRNSSGPTMPNDCGSFIAIASLAPSLSVLRIEGRKEQPL